MAWQMLAGAGLGAAANLIGGHMANQANAENAKYATDRSMQDAQLNRDFQKEMSGTAHQRQMADLKAAGLNPLLSGTGGQGASSPAGSTGNATAAKADNIVSGALASAVELTNMKQMLKKSDKEIENIEQTNQNLKTDNTLKQSLIKESGYKSDILRSDSFKERVNKKPYEYMDAVINKAENAVKSNVKSGPGGLQGIKKNYNDKMNYFFGGKP